MVAVMTCVSGYSAQAGPADISPPQGYIGFDVDFRSAAGSNAVPNEFYNVDLPLMFNSPLANHHGTFWSHQFTFTNSTAGLPSNHIGGEQGGYFGLQVLPDGHQIAIFSIWWASAAQPGAGASCTSDVEMWYQDDKPFDPPITDAAKTDHRRHVDGGPFRSCRLPVTLAAGRKYRLRIWKVGDPDKTAGAKWWGAWLINDDTKEEQQVGQMEVRSAWGGLSVGSTGFMEQFGPMPAGCQSIPSSTTTFFPATANAGSFTAKMSTNVYGACENAVKARYHASPSNGGISVVVR
jgi:uncharacterized protein DUF3472